MTTIMIMMAITMKTGAITPAMTMTLPLSAGKFVVVPSVIGVAENDTDVVSSMVVVLEDVSHVILISPELDACDIVDTIVGSVGVGRVTV